MEPFSSDSSVVPGVPRRLGRYEVVNALGRGASGQVVEAILHGPAGFRRRVALKLLHCGRQYDADMAVERLAREARLGGLFAHPNVVSTLELGVAGDVDDEWTRIWFVSMEIVRGPSLSQLLRTGPLSPAAVLDVGIQVAAALAHIHELTEDGVPLRLVHCDVKPGNVLLDPSGLVRLVDFGVAGLEAELEGRTVGTPGYLAPEQAQGHPEQRSDLFSLGMTLATLALGKNPFGTGIAAIQRAMDVERHLHLMDPLDDLAPGLTALVCRCLRADPGERWASARVLAVALRKVRASAQGTSLAEIAVEQFGRAPLFETDSVLAASTLDLPRRRPPAPRPEILGRDALVTQVVDVLRRGAWVSLTGPAGVGKTRIAQAVAADWPRAREVIWCDVSAARTPRQVRGALAGALGVDLDGESTSLDHAIRALDGLLVLDPVEHVADILADMLAAWSGPAVLLVGRAPVASPCLGSATVERVDVPPLLVADAAALFERARGTPIDPASRSAVDTLLEAVDRLPLAIELLAARSRLLPIPELQSRLHDRFRLLGGPVRSGSGARHATLEAAIGWSWDLLTKWEQAALGQLAMFESPFSLSLAESVLDSGRFPDAPWTLDILAALANQSLLSVDRGRFSMLRSVRAFASERLVASGEAAATARRHGAAFAHFGSTDALDALSRAGCMERLATLRLALPDLIAAAKRAAVREDGVQAVPCALAAIEILRMEAPADALELAKAVLSLPLEAAQRAALLRRASDLREVVGDGVGARIWLDECLALYGALGPSEGLVEAMVDRAKLLVQEGEPDAGEGMLREALASAREHGFDAAEQSALIELSALRRAQLRFSEALAHAQSALSVARARGDRRGEAVCICNIGLAQQISSDFPGAERTYQEALVALEETGNRRVMAIVQGNLGLVALSSGNRDRARERLEAAREAHRRLGARRSEAMVLGNLGVVLRDLGRPDRAWEATEAALAYQRTAGDKRAVGTLVSSLARLHADAGRQAAALACYEEAIAAHAASANPRGEIIVCIHRGLYLLSLGNAVSAEGDLDRAMAMVVETEDVALQGAVDVARARLLRLTGRRSEAVRALDDADRHLASRATLEDLAMMHAERGLLAVDGDPAGAVRHLAAGDRVLGEEIFCAPAASWLDDLREALRKPASR